DPQQGVDGQRGGDLAKERPLLFLPARRTEREHRLIGEHLLELIENEAARSGSLPQEPFQRTAQQRCLLFVGCDAKQSGRGVDVSDTREFDITGDSRANASERENLKPLPLQRRCHLRLEQRRLPGAGLRVDEEYGVADDERDDFLGLSVTAEEPRLILRRAPERTRSYVRINRGRCCDHCRRTPPSARLAREQTLWRPPNKRGP